MSKRSETPEQTTGLEEAIEVVRWYQHFIHVKLMRAVAGQLRERSQPPDEFPRDSDGSAKVALIAIDRSIGAWGEIRNQIPLGLQDIDRISMFSIFPSWRIATSKRRSP